MLATTSRTAPAARQTFDIGARLRWLAGLDTALLTMAATVALFKGLTGIAPDHLHTRDIAIVIHLATVLPAIPLGGYLLLARKGGSLHKTLGKVWVALMVATACSAFFIRSGGGFSLLHIFVPITLLGSYRVIATARAGNLTAHKRQILSLFFAALTIPGIFAFLGSGRLMNAWLFG